MASPEYRVKHPVIEGQVQVYGVGAVIDLAEAVRRGLPGAAEQAAGRKPMHSSEDRAHRPDENRGAA